MNEHKGGVHHAGEARKQLTSAYENLLKAAEKNNTFEYKDSIKREILESARGILSLFETTALRK